MPAIQHKQGDHFKLVGTVSKNGQVEDISQWTIRAEVRYGEQLVEPLTATVINGPDGKYQLSSAGKTTAWPIGELGFDVVYIVDGIEASTETVAINCIRRQTA